MRKATINQVVDAAIEVVKAAETEDAIRDVLMTCTKLVMVDVYDAIVGTNYTGPALKLKKAELANWVACQIMRWRKDEAFKALPYEKKFSEITNNCSRAKWYKKLDLFSLSELEETARRLEIPVRTEKYEIIDDIIREIVTRNQVSKIEQLMSSEDVDEMRNELPHVESEALVRLCRRYGLSDTEAAHKMRNDLLEYCKDNREAMNTTAVEEALVRAKGKAQRVKIFLGMSARQIREYMARNNMPLDTSADLIMSAGTATTQALEQLKASSSTSSTPLSQAFKRAHATDKPETVKFQIGHHYGEDGAAPQEVYTLIERTGDYGYFVDTFNVYYRRRIRELSGCEYATSPNAKGANAASTLSADSEVPVHEIISEKYGNVSVILHAGQVNTPAELEQLLKGASSKKEQAAEQPAIEGSIVRAKDTAEIRAILGALTTDELKVYAARNLLTEKIPVNGDILSSLVKATEHTLELFWKMRESDSEMGTATTPLSKAFTQIHGAAIPTCVVAGDYVNIDFDADGVIYPYGGSDDELGWECKKAWYRVHPEKLSFFGEIKGYTPEGARARISKQDWTLSGLRFEAGLLGIGGETVEELRENMFNYAIERGIVKTQEEYLLEERREIQQDLHELWLMRRAIMRAQRMSNISREDYEALGAMWSEFGFPQKLQLLYKYHDINLALAEERCEHEDIPA